MNKDLELNQNHIVSVLGKQPNEFTAEDIIGYIKIGRASCRERVSSPV